MPQFNLDAPEPVASVNLSLQGNNQSGKTAMALTAPLPIVHMACDLGWQRAITGPRRPMFEGLDIEVVDYDKTLKPGKHTWAGHDITIIQCPTPVQTDAFELAGVTELWDYLNQAIGLAMGDDYVRSIVIDTATTAREYRADAYLQGLQQENKKKREDIRKQLQQVEYGKVNPYIRDWYKYSVATRKNLVATHHLVEERERGPFGPGGAIIERFTGRYVLAGLSTTHDAMDIALSMVGVAEGIGANRTFNVTATFEKNGYVPELKGTTLMNPTWDSLMTWTELKGGGRLSFPKRGLPADTTSPPVALGVQQ